MLNKLEMQIKSLERHYGIPQRVIILGTDDLNQCSDNKLKAYLEYLRSQECQLKVEPEHIERMEADIKDTESSEIASTDIQEPTTPIPIDAKTRRLLLKDDYTEIFQEVLRCEYLCRQQNLRYDRVRYLGDYDLRKCKEFLLDYLSSLCDLLEYSIQERSAIQEFG